MLRVLRVSVAMLHKFNALKPPLALHTIHKALKRPRTQVLHRVLRAPQTLHEAPRAARTLQKARKPPRTHAPRTSLSGVSTFFAGRRGGLLRWFQCSTTCSGPGLDLLEQKGAKTGPFRPHLVAEDDAMWPEGTTLGPLPAARGWTCSSRRAWNDPEAPKTPKRD